MGVDVVRWSPVSSFVVAGAEIVVMGLSMGMGVRVPMSLYMSAIQWYSRWSAGTSNRLNILMIM